MRELVFLLEEESAKAFIEVVIDRLSPVRDDFHVRYIVFEGKQDLEKQIERKLRKYLNPLAVFIILRDQDSGDCVEIKMGLRAKCLLAKKPDAIVRIACRELESWFIADISAVSTAYGIQGLTVRQQRGFFRNPDEVESPSQELKKLVPGYQKVGGARKIARHIDLHNTRSTSFSHFMKKITENLQEKIQ